MAIQREARRFWESISPSILLITLICCSNGSAHEVPHNERTEATEASAQVDGIRDLVRMFRQTGDDRLLDRAWSLAEPQLETTKPAALIDAAVVAQARHDFDTALQLIDRTLDVRANYDQAWLLRASIQLVRGNVDEAAHACRELRHSPLLITATCAARVSIARGDNTRALRTVTAVLSVIDSAIDNASDEAIGTPRPAPGPYAWALSVAGDAAAPIDAERAIDFYTRSLAIVESTQVRSALIDVLLAANRIEAAARVLPENASHALALNVRRMIVERRLGQTSARRSHGSVGHNHDANHIGDSSESQSHDDILVADHQFRHWIANGDWVHAREMARFYLDVLDRPQLARRLAQTNLSLQREREDLLLAKRTGVLMTCAAC